MNRKLSVALVLGAIVMAGCTSTGTGKDPLAAKQPSRPNILLILADDLGYSDIGAFGGEINTPNLDALAASGRLVTNYRTGATCSPTRAMLMSGTDHHQAGLGSMAESLGGMIANNVAPFGAKNRYGFNNLPEGYEGYLNDRVLSLPQLMRDAGYHTYMAGKWHLASQVAERGPDGRPPFRPASFPNAKGFERSFVLLTGGASHFAPVQGKRIPADNAGIYLEDDKPAMLPAEFYSSNFYTDKLISYIDASKADGKPFFAYAAFTAPHNPLHAPDADIARYRGKYDEGYEAVRARRLARQKALGVVAADFQSNPGLDAQTGRPRWADLTPAQRASEARKMEVYAAMIENMDRNIGRLIQHLKQIGAYENTLIVFTSDNGSEGSNMHMKLNDNVDNSLANIGRPLSMATYGERWAEVSATPFRLWKGYSTEGGVSAPMIVRLPGQSSAKAASRDIAHVSDLLPTFLDAAGIAVPGTSYKGATVKPVTGVSLLPQLGGRATTAARGPDAVLADELFGGRYVIRGQWKLVSVPAPFSDNRWALYDLSKDRGETRDVIASHPEIAAQLIKDYDDYARRVGVVLAPIAAPRAPAP